MERADEYIHALTDAIALTAEDPMTGVSCDDIRPGYRKRVSGSHVVFYKRVQTSVVIVRVLHQNMDFARILH